MPGKLVSRMSKRECHTLNETDTIKEASKRLHENKIGCMPILDNNRNIIGIISERDLSQLIYTEKFNLNLSVAKILIPVAFSLIPRELYFITSALIK